MVPIDYLCVMGSRARFIEHGLVFFEAFFVGCSNMLVWFPPMRNTTNGCKSLHPFRYSQAQSILFCAKA